MVAIMFVGFLFFLPKYNLPCQNRKQELNRIQQEIKIYSAIYFLLFFFLIHVSNPLFRSQVKIGYYGSKSRSLLL